MAEESNAGTIVLVIVIFLLLAGGGGFAVYWFVLKPKWEKEAEEKKLADAAANAPVDPAPGSPPPTTTPPAPTSAPALYGVPLRVFNMSTTGGYLSPCGTSRHTVCGVDITLRPDISFEPVPHIDTQRQRVWALESASGKAGGSSILFGDVVKIKSMSTKSGETGLYASPCGAADSSAECAIDVTLRLPSNYQNDPTLIQWKVEGGVEGQAIQWNDTVYLKGMNTTQANHGGWLAACGSDGICGTDVTVLDKAGHESECQWRLEKFA